MLSKSKPESAGLRLSADQERQLRQALEVFDQDRDKRLNLTEYSEARRAMHGRKGVPFITGDSQRIMRKYANARALSREQAVDAFRAELEQMPDRQAAEDALWRLISASDRLAKLTARTKVVTQADFDAVWARAEQMQERGEPTTAGRLFEKARLLKAQIRSTKAIGALDLNNRRIKQDLKHVQAEQKAERLQLKCTGKIDTVVPLESPSAWELPRGWVEHRLLESAEVPEGGKRYYYGLKTGRSVWHRPHPEDFSEDVLAPVKVQIATVKLSSVIADVSRDHKTPLVVDPAPDGPLVKELAKKANFVSEGTSRDELKSELKKAMKFGFPVVFDARSDHGKVAVAQFNELYPGLLHLITCNRAELLKKDFFDLLDVSKLERRIFGVGKVADNFNLIWLQADMVLPSWGTCDTSVVIMQAIAPCEQLSTKLNKGKQDDDKELTSDSAITA